MLLCAPADTMVSKSQESNWDFTESFRNMETENFAPTLRKKRSISSVDPVPDPVPEEEEDLEEKKLLEEFNALIEKVKQSNRTYQFNVVALAGKKSGGAVFVPQETAFFFNGQDIDQVNAVRVALTKKAREWKEKNPGIINAFQLIETTGFSDVTISAVGGIEFGCSRIPMKPKDKGKTSTTSTTKKAVKKGAKKQKKA